MENERLISVKECAEALNVSPQAIYQQLDKKLKPFLKVVKGKKYIVYKGLEELYPETFKEVEQEVDKNLKDSLKDNEPDKITDKLVEMLQQELIAKNKQIDDLNARLKEVNNMLDQEQRLNALNSKKVLELEDQLKKNENTNVQDSMQEDPAAMTETTGTKKGFFARLFGK